MGHGALADAALLPDFAFLDSADMPIVTGMTEMKADYRLSIDNLMDLSHIEFVHRGTFGGRGIIKDSVYEVVETPDAIEARWTMNDIPPPRAGLGADRVDHWLHMRWQAPSSLRLEAGYKPAGAGEQHGRRDLQAHILTPTTGVSSLYFWAAPARIAVKPGDPHDPDRNDLRTAFDVEDKPMIEAVQRNTGNRDLFENKLAFLPYDRGAVRVRQRLQALIAQEQDSESSGDLGDDAAQRSVLSDER
jgi:vanillate O-demethylase monooxygenase subunit